MLMLTPVLMANHTEKLPRLMVPVLRVRVVTVDVIMGTCDWTVETCVER